MGGHKTLNENVTSKTEKYVSTTSACRLATTGKNQQWQVRNKGNDSMKSFDIESGEVDTENSNRSSTNMSVGVPLQQSLRRHTIASASRLRVTLEEEERNGIGKGKGK